MNIVFKRPTIYFSHPIRGSNNNIKENCERAKRAAAKLRRTFPEIDIYCPAEGDLTLQILTSNNKLEIDDVMFADLTILKACHEWFCYNFDVSKGASIEGNGALSVFMYNNGEYTSRWITENIEKASYAVLRKIFGPIVTSAQRRFRRQCRRK